MIKVSIIVPVYNKEEFLYEAIESIINQTLKEIEIILVNDGSTDRSADICKKFVSVDSRIKYIETENSGVSNARNVGLKEALGEYIGFVDADDWIESEMYSKLVCGGDRDQSEIILCDYNHYDGTEIFNVSTPWGKRTNFDNKEIKTYIIPSLLAPFDLEGNKQEKVLGSVCRAIFKREFLEKSGVAFNTNIRFSEDLVYLIETMVLASRVTYVKEYLYTYRLDKITRKSTTQNYIDNLFIDLQLTQQILKNVIKNNQHVDDLEMHFHYRNISIVNRSIKNLFLPNCSLNYFNKVSNIKLYIKKSKYKQSVKVVNLKFFNKFRKILIILARYSLVNSITIIYMLKYQNKNNHKTSN